MAGSLSIKTDPAGKRAFDLALALLLFLPATLLCVPLAFLIHLADGASPIFLQVRVGQANRPFRLYKLRTMRTDSPNLPTHQSSTSHVTRLGKFLRRTKLDELPQLLNVLRGDMSFVGPRPCLPTQTDLMQLRDRLGVSALRPGITGVSQIAGLDMSDPLALAASDATYAWSLRTDLAILSRTLFGSGTGDAMLAPHARDVQDDGADR